MKQISFAVMAAAVLAALLIALLISTVGLGVAKQETVSMGPYNVSFDLGTVNHTIEVYPPQYTGNYAGGTHRTMYVMRIHFPNDKDAEIWIDAGPKTIGIGREISGLIGTLESNSVNLEPGNSTAVGKAYLDTGVVDGLPGLVGSINHTDGSTFFIAEYHLESRGNEAGGWVQLFSFDPYASMLINTIHVTELVAHTTYIAEPAVTYVPKTTYVTE